MTRTARTSTVPAPIVTVWSLPGREHVSLDAGPHPCAVTSTRRAPSRACKHWGTSASPWLRCDPSCAYTTAPCLPPERQPRLRGMVILTRRVRLLSHPFISEPFHSF